MFARLSSVLAPIAVFAAMLLFGQAALCFADHSGTAACAQASADGHCGEKSPISGEDPNSAAPLSCCHAHASVAAQDRDGDLIAGREFSSQPYDRQDFACVEGPVRAIDYPPQMS